jgi:hypothetical protein
VAGVAGKREERRAGAIAASIVDIDFLPDRLGCVGLVGSGL